MDVLNHRCAEILQSLYQFQKDGYLCDTVLVADDGELKAHSAVLAATSPFLREVLTSTEKPMQHVVVLSDFRSDILQVALHFIYSGTLDIPAKYLDNEGITAIIVALQKLELKVSASDARAENHAMNLMQTLYQFQNDSYLCDTTLVAEDSQLKAHSVVLVADSTLFKSRPPHSDKPVKHTIDLAEYQSHFVRAALHFIYCANLSTPGHATVCIALQELANGIQLADRHDSSAASHMEACTSSNEMPPRSAMGTGSSVSLEFIKESTADGNGSEHNFEPNCHKTETAEVSFSEFCIDSVVSLSTNDLMSSSSVIPLKDLEVLITDTSMCQVTAINNEETISEVEQTSVLPHATDSCRKISANRKSCREISSKQETEKSSVSNCFCFICHRKFSSPTYLRLHEQVHNGSVGSFRCAVCGVKILHRENLKRHMKHHTSKLKYTCSTCGRSFDRRYRYRNHLRMFHLNESMSEVEQTSVLPRTATDTCRKISPNRKSCREISSKQKTKKSDDSNCFCFICHRKFSSPTHLRLHGRVHTGSVQGTVQCAVCGVKILHKKNLKAHMMRHTGELKYTCSDCGRSFSARDRLLNHLQMFHPDKEQSKAENDKFTCRVCGKKITNPYNLKEHVRRHMGIKRNCRRYPCVDCGRSFTQISVLRKHCQITHSVDKNSQSVVEVCEICGAKFSNYMYLSIHKKMHDQPAKPSIFITCLVCSLCGTKLPSMHSLSRHMKKHTGLTSYVCSYCSRNFSNLKCLRNHSAKTHAGEENQLSRAQDRPPQLPFVCQTCQHHFVTQEGLYIHMLRCDADFRVGTTDSGKSHVDSPDCVCDICGVTFSSSSNLSQHQKAHERQEQGVKTNEIIFICTVCGAKMLNSSKVLSHMRQHASSSACTNLTDLVPQKTHTGDQDGPLSVQKKKWNKSFTCPFCGIKFINKSNLSRHMKHLSTGKLRKITASDKIDFTCEVCGQKIKYRRNVVSHMKRHPGDWGHIFSEQKVHKPENNSVTCTICGVKITRNRNWKYNLKRHMKCHTGEPRDEAAKIDFTCPVCGKKITRKRNAKSHMMLHMEKWSKQNSAQNPGTCELLYICQTCWHGFQSRQELCVHLWQSHFDFTLIVSDCGKSDVDVSGFVCDICGVKFSSPSHLRQHREAHKPLVNTDFVCSVCGKKTSDRNHLKQHMKCHARVKFSNPGRSKNLKCRSLQPAKHDIACIVCAIKFTTRKSLNRHMRRHTGDATYACPDCDRSFTRAYTLKKHVEAVHTGEVA